MGQHSKPEPAPGRKDVVVVHMQFELVLPKEYREQYPYPISHDAINVARLVVPQLPPQELYDLAGDTMQWQFTKPSRLR